MNLKTSISPQILQLRDMEDSSAAFQAPPAAFQAPLKAEGAGPSKTSASLIGLMGDEAAL